MSSVSSNVMQSSKGPSTILSKETIALLTYEYKYGNNEYLVNRIMQTVDFEEIRRIAITNPELAILGFGGYDNKCPATLDSTTSHIIMKMFGHEISEVKVVALVNTVLNLYKNKSLNDKEMSFVVRTIASSCTKCRPMDELLRDQNTRAKIERSLDGKHRNEFIAAYLNAKCDVNLVMNYGIGVNADIIEILRSDLLEDMATRMTHKNHLLQPFIEWLMRDPYNCRYTNINNNMDVLVALLLQSIGKNDYTTLICNVSITRVYEVLQHTRIQLDDKQPSLLKHWLDGNSSIEVVVPLRLISHYDNTDSMVLRAALKLLSSDLIVEGIDTTKVIKYCKCLLDIE